MCRVAGLLGEACNEAAACTPEALASESDPIETRSSGGSQPHHGVPSQSRGDDALQRLQEHIHAHPQHKHGVRRHNLRDLGLDPNDVRERFAAYTKWFSRHAMVHPRNTNTVDTK